MNECLLNNQVFATAFTFSIDPFIPIVFSSLYFYFGGKNWKIPLMPAMIFPVISFVISFFIPESPRYLYAKKDWKGVRKVVKTMSRINGADMETHYFIDEEITYKLNKSKVEIRAALEQQETVGSLDAGRNKENEYSVLKALKDSTILANFLVSLALFSFISFNYYMIAFYIKYIGGNIFMNTLAALISECIGNFGVGFIHR